jgi:hypothetical protein
MAFPQTHLLFASTGVDAVTRWWAGFIAMALAGLSLTSIGSTRAPIRTVASA